HPLHVAESNIVRVVLSVAREEARRRALRQKESVTIAKRDDVPHGRLERHIPEARVRNAVFQADASATEFERLDVLDDGAERSLEGEPVTRADAGTIAFERQAAQTAAPRGARRRILEAVERDGV